MTSTGLRIGLTADHFEWNSNAANQQVQHF